MCNGLLPLNRAGACKYGQAHHFYMAQAVSSVRALRFYVCEGSSQPIEPIKHAKNYGIDIFDYEGHDL